jgi:hypothetical protein
MSVLKKHIRLYRWCTLNPILFEYILTTDHGSASTIEAEACRKEEEVTIKAEEHSFKLGIQDAALSLMATHPEV